MGKIEIYFYEEIGREIAQEVKSRIRDMELFCTSARDALCLSNCSITHSYIPSVCKGNIYGDSGKIAANNDKNVLRLANFLYCLGLEENHPIIRAIGEVDSRFEYPPTKTVTQFKVERAVRKVLRGKIDKLSSDQFDRAGRFLDVLISD
jgi:hypothetical protein